MRAAGESSKNAVLLAPLVGVAQQPLKTEEDWHEFQVIGGKLEGTE